jgi:hypothetical protein
VEQQRWLQQQRQRQQQVELVATASHKEVRSDVLKVPSECLASYVCVLRLHACGCVLLLATVL